MRSSTKLLAISWVALSSCANPLPPPKGEVCRINMVSSTPYRLCFEMSRDFDQDGYLKPSAKGVRRPLDLHGHWEMDESTIGNLRAYLFKVRDRYQRDCQK